jgi:glycosyltransferase involved in cell wall biosynthesis
MSVKVSIIIPFLNEEEGMPSLLEALNQYIKSLIDFKVEVIFVNDGSTDNSMKVLKQSMPLQFEAKVISLSKNFGSHAALRSGILNASGDYIVFMYADLQDPLEIIGSLYHKCKEGCDIAWAMRRNTNNSFIEQKFSMFYAAMMKKYAMANYPQKGFDVVMFDKKVQFNLNANMEANSSIFLQILQLGYKQETIEYDKQVRKIGKSKWTLKKKIKLFIDSFVAFSYAPIRFVTIMGFAFFFIGICWTAYVIFRKFFVGDIASGWPALISILFLGFGVTNISLGIIAEYLWRTLDASRKRPVFIIDEITELNKHDK